MDGGSGDSVIEYDIESDTYKTMPSLPAKLMRGTLLLKNDFLYHFGGLDLDDGENPVGSVYRIATDMTGGGDEDLEDMTGLEGDDKYPLIVVPYN